MVCTKVQCCGFKKHSKSKLENVGFQQATEIDPCLFISPKCICLVYVDDTLFFAPKPEYIDEAIEKLRATGMVLEREDSVAGFLGVLVERDETNGQIKLVQEGLTVDLGGLNATLIRSLVLGPNETLFLFVLCIL